MRALLLPLLCGSVSIAYSRPGETSVQIEQRFGKPLTQFQMSGFGDETRPASATPITPSLRESSRIYRFGEIEVTVYFFDNRSQREEFKRGKYGVNGGLQKAEIDQILKGANNGAPWTVESEKEGGAVEEYTKKRILERGLSSSDHAYYKANGLRAWMEVGRFAVETDAFRALRLANKPEVQKPISPQGKGF